jgi:4Fe-4S ferredoxin
MMDFIKQEQYPRLLAEATPNEKCLPCLLCEPVCPTKAIKVTFNKTREDYGPLRPEMKGKIAIDREKCNLCGRCAKFCKAFLLVDKGEKEKDPRNLVPYEQLLVDEELCDYCGLCVSLCPEEAINVEGEPLEVPEGEKEFVGKIEIDQDLCIGCGRCAQVCPYEAMDTKKPFQGEIKLVAILRAARPASTSARPNAGMWMSAAKRRRSRINASFAGHARRPVPSRPFKSSGPMSGTRR